MRRQKRTIPVALGNDDPLTRRREKFLRGKNAEGIAIRFGDAHTVKPCLGKKNGIIFPILQLLQTREAVKYSVCQLVKEQEEQGVIYSEIRFAPQLHMQKG